MRRILYGLVTALSLLFLMACGKEQAKQVEGLRIVTSFYPIYALTKEVSGDLNDVRMIQSGSGIHSFEPSVGDIQAIYDADLFFYHASILESWVKRLSPEAEGSSVKLIEASANLELQRVTGLEDVPVSEGMDESTLYDPHTWLDPILVGEEAVAIAEELSQVDPEHAEVYKNNATKLKERAEEITNRYQEIFAKASQKTFVTQHTAFSYTASRFGLVQLGIAGVSEEEPSPRQLAEIKDFIETYDVKTIFVERGVSDKLAQALATSTKVELKVLEPLEADPQNNLSFLDNLEENLSILAAELQETKK